MSWDLRAIIEQGICPIAGFWRRVGWAVIAHSFLDTSWDSVDARTIDRFTERGEPSMNSKCISSVRRCIGVSNASTIWHSFMIILRPNQDARNQGRLHLQTVMLSDDFERAQTSINSSSLTFTISSSCRSHHRSTSEPGRGLASNRPR